MHQQKAPQFINLSSKPTRRFILASASLSLFASALRGRQNQSTPSFSTGVNVVNVFATVRDKKENIIQNLAKDDFVLTEDGHEQSIKYFTRQSDLPLTLGLLVDATPSESNMLGVERSASSLFFEQVLRPNQDNAFVIQFADDVELLQDLTSSRERLEKALDLLGNSGEAHRSRQDDDPDQRSRRPRGGGGADSTVLSDAVFLGANEILKPRTGRKAMIILGDGDHVGNRERQAVEAAQRTDCLVYAVRIYDKDFGGGGSGAWHGLSFPGGGMPGMGNGGQGGPGGGGPGRGGSREPGGVEQHSNGKLHLQEISRQTGGSYFEVTKKQSLEQIYRKIEDELRNQYSLGYTPTLSSDNSYRKIKVATRQADLIVQAREGYYPSLPPS